MIQFHPKVFGDLRHMHLDIILHATAQAEELFDLTGVENEITA